MLTRHPNQPPNPASSTRPRHKPSTLVARTRPGFIDEVDGLPIHDNRPKPQPPRNSTQPIVATAPRRPFVASSPAIRTRPVRRVLFGWSIAIGLAAQGLIGATVATGGDPVIGAAATVAVMTCSLLLIAADYLTAKASMTGWVSAARMPAGRDRQVAGREGKRRRRFRPTALGNTELLLLPTDTTEEVAKW